MSNFLNSIDYCAYSAMITMMLMALAYSIVMPVVDRWCKRFFITFFSFLLLCACAGFIDLIIFEIPGIAQTEKIVLFWETLFLSTLMIMPTILFLHYCGEPLKDSILFRTAIALWVVFFIMLVISCFTDIFFIVTPDSQYVRTSWYPLGILPLSIIMILNVIGLIIRRNKLSKRYFVAFLIYLLPMTVIVAVLMFVPIYLHLFLGVVICALSMYAIIVSDQIVQHFRQQREIAHQHASVMVLQMRPHFIYNTMMSIYYLCKQDADKAQQVTLDFTTYLRKNFTAIASENMVDFKEELEHTRAYLAVEQAQHEDMLYVDYDTPHTRFRIPPLTLQPLVENAVKHSLDPNGDPLHIYIRTRLIDKNNEITVENTGADFKPSDDSEPHTALTNISQRLEMMCGGKMTFSPRNGGGTIVKVILPQKR